MMLFEVAHESLFFVSVLTFILSIMWGLFCGSSSMNFNAVVPDRTAPDTSDSQTIAHRFELFFV
jgi:hypothetical protein